MAPRSVPPWLRRLADVVLAFTAVTIPLSISGMQIGIGTLFGLAVLAPLVGARVVRRTPLDGWLALFLGVLVLSTLASLRPHEAGGWSRMWVLIGFFGIYWWLDPARAVRFTGWLVAGGTVAAVYGVVQHWTGADWYRTLMGRELEVRARVEGAGGYAVIGFFSSYLTFAHLMVFPLAAATTRALAGSVRAGGASVLMLASIVLSTARGAWIALLGGVVVLALVGGRRWAVRLVPAALVVAALTVGASPHLRAQIEPMFTLEGPNAGRVAIYRANLDIVHDHPWLGFGFGRYRPHAKPYYEPYPAADRKSHAHNNFLHMAAEAGLLGLTAFALLYAAILRLGWEAVRATRGGPIGPTAAGAWLGIVAFLLGGLTQYNFGDNEVAIAMWATTAVLLRCRDA
ncbi:MAG: O-antigen ligase family protein [bacterium]|nr:O-antigen ligase family protein [bacterium]